RIDLKRSAGNKLNIKIINNVVGTLAKRKDIQTLKDVRDYIARINKHLGLSKQLGDSYAKAVLKGIVNERVAIVDAKAIQKNSFEYAKKQSEYNTNFRYNKDVNDFAAVSIDDLNKTDRQAFVSGFTKLVTGRIPTNKEYNVMINFGKKEVAKKALMPIASQLHLTYKNNLEHYVKTILFSTIISKFNKIVGDKFSKNIYVNLMEGYAKATEDSVSHSRKVNEIADKNRLNHHDLTTVGMYGRVFSTLADPNNKVEWINEIRENAEAVLQAAQDKLKAYEADNYTGDLSEK